VQGKALVDALKVNLPAALPKSEVIEIFLLRKH
jgi:hypothetical protein